MSGKFNGTGKEWDDGKSRNRRLEVHKLSVGRAITYGCLYLSPVQALMSPYNANRTSLECPGIPRSSIQCPCPETNLSQERTSDCTYNGNQPYLSQIGPVLAYVSLNSPQPRATGTSALMAPGNPEKGALISRDSETTPKIMPFPVLPTASPIDVRSVVMIGPWGGTGGKSQDIRDGIRSRYLETITVTSSKGGRINGFNFVYVDYEGQSIDVCFCGSKANGNKHTMTMASGEHVNYVSGTVDETSVTSLMFWTNKRVQRTYGKPSGTPFSVPLQGGGEVLGFFGLADSFLLVALGLYVAAGV